MPFSRSSEASEMLVNVNASWITPWPQGDSAAPRNASRLNVKRWASISLWVITMSHIRFSAGEFFSMFVTWSGVVGSGITIGRGTWMLASGEYSDGLTLWRIALYSRRQDSLLIVRFTVLALRQDSDRKTELSASYWAKSSWWHFSRRSLDSELSEIS